MRKEQFSYFSFQIFFGFWAKIFSDFWRKLFKKLSKLPSACPEEQFVAWNIFWKLWIVLIFSAETFGMVLKFLSTCPELKLRKKQFSYFSFQNFFGFWAKNFSDFWPKKRQEFVKTFFDVSRGTICFLEFFLSFESFPIFCRNHWHGSQNSIYESRLKIAVRNCFFVFFPDFFRFLSENFSDFWPNLRKVVKTTFCVSTGTTCGFISFKEVLNRFGFSAETFGLVLKFLSTCLE